MNNAADSTTDSPLEKEKKTHIAIGWTKSELNLNWEKAGWLPAGIIDWKK